MTDITDRSSLGDGGSSWKVFTRRFAKRKLPGFMDGNARRFAVTFGIVTVVGVVALPFMPHRYVSSSAVILHMSEQDDTQTGLKQGILDDGSVQSEMDRMSSFLLVGRVIDQLNLAADQAIAPRSWPSGNVDLEKLKNSLRQRISVTRERRSYTLQVSYWDADPRRSAKIANGLVNAYVDDQISRKKAAIEAQTSRLEERASLLRVSSKTSDNAVRDFITQTGIIDRGDGSELQSQLAILSGELSHVQVGAIQARVRAEALVRLQRSGEVGSSQEVLASAPVQRAREMLAAAEAKPAALTAETTGLRRQIDVEVSRVVKAASQDVATWSAREEMLYAEIKRVRAEMVRRRLDELKLEQLRLAANADETALADCLAKLKGQLGKTKAIQSDADIVVQAVPPSDAAFPKPILAYLGTFLAACLAGAASTAPRAGLRRSWDAQMRRIRGCAQGAPSQDRP